MGDSTSWSLSERAAWAAAWAACGGVCAAILAAALTLWTSRPTEVRLDTFFYPVQESILKFKNKLFSQEDAA